MVDFNVNKFDSADRKSLRRQNTPRFPKTKHRERKRFLFYFGKLKVIEVLVKEHEAIDGDW